MAVRCCCERKEPMKSTATNMILGIHKQLVWKFSLRIIITYNTMKDYSQIAIFQYSININEKLEKERHLHWHINTNNDLDM